MLQLNWNLSDLEIHITLLKFTQHFININFQTVTSLRGQKGKAVSHEKWSSVKNGQTILRSPPGQKLAMKLVPHAKFGPVHVRCPHVSRSSLLDTGSSVLVASPSPGLALAKPFDPSLGVTKSTPVTPIQACVHVKTTPPPCP